jgi:hypothetical protein
MKNWYEMARVRYRGLARNNCDLQFVRAEARRILARFIFIAQTAA